MLLTISPVCLYDLYYYSVLRIKSCIHICRQSDYDHFKSPGRTAGAGSFPRSRRDCILQHDDCFCVHIVDRFQTFDCRQPTEPVCPPHARQLCSEYIIAVPFTGLHTGSHQTIDDISAGFPESAFICFNCLCYHACHIACICIRTAAIVPLLEVHALPAYENCSTMVSTLPVYGLMVCLDRWKPSHSLPSYARKKP